MNHPLFETLGQGYPHRLEEKFDRILTQIEKLWGTPAIEDYFSDLIIDRRGNRKGFPKDVMDEIIMLRQLHQTETFKKAHNKEYALAELKKRGVALSNEAFFNAIDAGDRGLVDLFIQVNFNIRVTDAEGNSPLLIAIKKGYTVIANMLIKAGVEVNEYDKLGETPLLMVCGKKSEGYTSIAENLIARGAYINERDRNGFTPLMLSILGGTDEVTQLLIEKRADVNAGTRSGMTPMTLAKSAGNGRIVELLLKHGAIK